MRERLTVTHATDGFIMRRIGSHRRTGSAYIVLLGVSMIVTVIGVSSLLAVRIELRAAQQTEAAVQAELGAPPLIEVALLRLMANPNWRSTESNDTWTADETVNGITFNFKLVDEQDGDLANDPNQPVRLYAKAAVGDAVRLYSVLLESQGSGSGTLDVRIATGNDDAEEDSGSGWMYLDSGDIELPYDATGYGTDTAGLRFTNIDIPQGATVQNAYIQFKVDSGANSGTVMLWIRGEDTDDASQFTVSSYSISSRSQTSAFAPWWPPDWDAAVGEAGTDQRTTDISSIIQEIVDRPGWASGNTMAIIIDGFGFGTRSAESYEGDANGAALLHVELDGSGGTLTPVSGTWRRMVTP